MAWRFLSSYWGGKDLSYLPLSEWLMQLLSIFFAFIKWHRLLLSFTNNQLLLDQVSLSSLVFSYLHGIGMIRDWCRRNLGQDVKWTQGWDMKYTNLCHQSRWFTTREINTTWREKEKKRAWWYWLNLKLKAIAHLH